MKLKKIFRILLITGLIAIICILLCILVFVSTSINDVKNIDVSQIGMMSSYCSIYNRDNELINKDHSMFDQYTNIKDIPPQTISAFLSIEDKDFFKHNGLNYKRIAKAIFNNIISNSYKEGASTITQQLIKNKYLSNEKTLSRKVKEAYLSLKLEAKEDKNKILESYLNTIYYGHGAYGISNASHMYFNKKPNELTLGESAVLAGIIKSPSYYSPINHKDECIKRRNLVLSEMLRDSAISQEEYTEAINQDIVLNIKPILNINNMDLYSKFVLQEASQLLNLSEEEILNRNYKIYTYQDTTIQKALDKVIQDSKYYQVNDYGNVADSLSIIIDNNDAGVSAVSGKSKYNLVNFKRQPGSLIKPVLVYTPALEKGLIYPCSQILDEKISFNNYSPQNVSDRYYGYVSIYDAIAKSLNIPAVKLCQELGIENCKEFVTNCGLDFCHEDNGLAISLGGLTEGYTLQQITNAYLPYSNNGLYKKSSFISKIISPQNLPVYINKMSESRYCSQDSAYLMTDILNYSVHNGTSKKLSNLPFYVAGKTGTVNAKHSNLNTDAYSLAYTSKHTMSVWLGNYSMDKKYNLNGNNNGGTFATSIIYDTFKNIYKDDYPKDFISPETIISLPIDNLRLEQDHIVSIAEKIPDKYVSQEIFSINNIPLNKSNKFDQIVPSSINFNISKNTCVITFDTLEYQNYSLYRCDSNNNTSLLKKVKNNNGLFTYIDSDIDYNKKYFYYLTIESDYTDCTYKSPKKEVVVEKNYKNLLNNNNDNLSWLFS